MTPRIAGLAIAVALLAHTALCTAQSSANYAMLKSTRDSGVGVMASANYKATSSLGEGYATGSANSGNFLYDVNVDGKLTVAYKGLVNAKR